MSHSEEKDEVFREAQLSRVARWLRDSEAGHLFYGPDGTCYHVLESEAAEIESFAHQWIDRGAANGFSPIPTAYFAYTVAGLFVAGGVSWFLFAISQRLWVTSYFQEMFLAAIAIAPLWYISDRIGDWRYETGLRKWRKLVCAKLEREGRGGVSRKTAQTARRHNLFRMGYFVFSGLAAVLFLYAGFSDMEPEYKLMILIPFFGCLITAGGMSWAADRVDDTHRRRKWLD